LNFLKASWISFMMNLPCIYKASIIHTISMSMEGDQRTQVVRYTLYQVAISFLIIDIFAVLFIVSKRKCSVSEPT